MHSIALTELEAVNFQYGDQLSKHVVDKGGTGLRHTTEQSTGITPYSCHALYVRKSDGRLRMANSSQFISMVSAMPIEILIADDHPQFRTSLRQVIDSQVDMHVVDEAANGVEAVNLVQRHHPHIVLMDIRMPEMDGVDATHHICASSNNIRVIALSSYAENPFNEKMIEAGACLYLSKSCDREELLAGIREVGKDLLGANEFK